MLEYAAEQEKKTYRALVRNWYYPQLLEPIIDELKGITECPTVMVWG
jgi:hypothetical protein